MNRDDDRLGYYALFLAIVKGYSQKEAFAALKGAGLKPDGRSHKKKVEEAAYEQLSLFDFMEPHPGQ